MKSSFFEKYRFAIIGCVLVFLSFIGIQILSLCLFCGGFSQLLPVTLPTKVRFVDEKTGDSLSNLPVHFTWCWTEATAQGSGRSGTYFELREITDAKGEINLPMRARTFPILLFPLYARIFEGIQIQHGNPQYWLEHKKPNFKGGLEIDRPWQYMGGQFKYVMMLPRENFEGRASNLSDVAYSFGRAPWNKGFDDLLNSAGGLSKLPDKALEGLADSCWYRVDNRCEAVDQEIMRRDPQGESFQGIRALTRQGLWKQAAIVIGKHMHQRAPGCIAWDREQAILKEYSTVKQLLTASENLRAKENIVNGTDRPAIETLNRLVGNARKSMTDGNKQASISAWLAVEPWLNTDELVEAGRTAQELELWRLCERFSRQALLLNNRSADGWELRSMAQSQIVESESITHITLRTNAAKQAAIRSIKLGGQFGAWLALADALDHQYHYGDAKQALLKAVKLEPNNPELKKRLSRHESIPPSETPMKLDLPDET